MGSFFANVSFKRKDMSKEKLIDAVKSVADENSFLVNFNEKKAWVTIYSELFEYGEVNPFEFSSMLSGIIKTPVLAVQCVDSDFIFLGLAINGEVDMCCVGLPYDVDDENDKPKPNIEFWSEFLTTPDEKEAFLKIIDDDYIFCEESLEPLSVLLGFDESDINKTTFEAVEDPALIVI